MERIEKDEGKEHMSSEKKIFLNTFYLSLGKIITSGLGVISFGVLAHYFSLQQMGEYNLILSFVGFLTIFADFGLGTLLTREIAAQRADNKLISLIFSLRLLLSVLFIGFGSLTIFLFHYASEVNIGVVIFSVANVFSMLSLTIWAIFQAKFLFKKMVIIQIITSVSSLLLLVVAVTLHLSLIAFVFAMSLSLIIGFFISYQSLQEKISLLFNKKSFLAIIKEAWPLGAGVITSVLYFKVDSLILPYFYNPLHFPDAGYYATAYKIFEVTMVFGGFYTQTLFPLFSAHSNRKDFKKDFRKYLVYTVAIAIVANICLFFLAKPFLFILGGEKYFPAIPSLEILSFALLGSILSGFFLNINIAGNKQLLLFKFAVVAAILNIGLNLLIIPTYSFIGASWVTLFTQLFILVTMIYTTLLVLKQRKFATIQK